MTELIARADGYTLLMTTSGTVRQNRVLYTKLRETFAIPNKPKNLENISDILKPL